MLKRLGFLSKFILAFLLINSTLVYAQPTFDPTNPPLAIASGSSVYYPWKINFPNNTIQSNADGSLTFFLTSVLAPYLVNPMTQLGDIIYGGAGGTPTRYGIGTANQVLHANGTPQWSAVVEDDISLSNVVTNNATAARHGFLPTLSSDPTQFLNGDGNFTIPSGVVNSYKSQSFNTVASVSVVHNFGVKPVVQVLGQSGQEIIPWIVQHDTNNSFNVQFTAATTGVVIATVGSPQPQNLISVSSDYSATATDRIIVLNTEGLTVTLPLAAGNTGREYIIKDATLGTGAVVCVNPIIPIDGASSQTLTAASSINLFSDGTSWLIY